MDGHMKCPSCGHTNIAGVDECESCHEDLASLDGVVPKSKIEKVLMSDPLSRVIPQKPLIVTKATSVYDAVLKMNAAKVGCALVAESGNGGLEGIVTERDVVLKAVGLGRNLREIQVGSLMTPAPETLSEDDTLAYAVNKMALGGYRHIPILRDDRPVGVISIRDVLRYLSKLFP